MRDAQRDPSDQSLGAPVCRYRTADGLVLDAMPLDGDVLGFRNRWYPLIMDTAISVDLSGGITIRAAHPVVLLATKWEAFHDRGSDDLFGCHDREDLLMLIAGRPELAEDLVLLAPEARASIELNRPGSHGDSERFTPPTARATPAWLTACSLE